MIEDVCLCLLFAFWGEEDSVVLAPSSSRKMFRVEQKTFTVSPPQNSSRAGGLPCSCWKIRLLCVRSQGDLRTTAATQAERCYKQSPISLQVFNFPSERTRRNKSVSPTSQSSSQIAHNKQSGEADAAAFSRQM